MKTIKKEKIIQLLYTPGDGIWEPCIYALTDNGRIFVTIANLDKLDSDNWGKFPLPKELL